MNIHEKYSFYKNKGLSGLSNLGNTCYINSILQCLSNTLSLTHFLLTSKVVDNNLIQMYIKVLIEIWKENSPLAPKSFKKCLDIVLPKYKGNNQQDAHEFLLDFLNYIHTSLPIKEVHFNTELYSNKYIKQALETWKIHIKKSSVISNLFYGQYIKKFKCISCNHTFRSYEPFLSLDVYCQKAERPISSYINSHFKRDYQYFSCENCGNKVQDIEHEVDTGIFKLPEILIISLKRFQKNKKNLNYVFIDDTLDFSEYSYNSTDEGVIYNIKSIVCHTGKSLDHGHYFSIIKIDNKWIKFNDIEVKQIDIADLDPSYPYILFYERKK